MMDSRATDTQFLDSMDKSFGLLPLAGLSKSEKFDYLFQHQMPTLGAWAMVGAWLIFFMGLVGSLVFFAIANEVSGPERGFKGALGIFVGTMFFTFMFRMIIFIGAMLLPVIFFRTLLANRGVFIYWFITFAVRLFLWAVLHFSMEIMDIFIKEVHTICGGLIAFRFLCFLVLTFLYFLYRPTPPKQDTPKKNTSKPTENLDDMNLDEHLIR